MTRLTWVQNGQVQCQDFLDRGAAEDAKMILEPAPMVRDVQLRELEPGEEADTSGPRPLTGSGGAALLDPDAWRGTLT